VVQTVKVEHGRHAHVDVCIMYSVCTCKPNAREAGRFAVGFGSIGKKKSEKRQIKQRKEKIIWVHQVISAQEDPSDRNNTCQRTKPFDTDARIC
jgi:hypothetical protein